MRVACTSAARRCLGASLDRPEDHAPKAKSLEARSRKRESKSELLDGPDLLRLLAADFGVAARSSLGESHLHK